MKTIGFVLLSLGITCGAYASAEPDKLLFGDTHLHTSYSFDAYLNKNETADPDTAYRWARGLPVVHPYNRARVQLETPLDFLVVSDHAELMGVMRALHNDTAELDDLGLWGNFKRWITVKLLIRSIDGNDAVEAFNAFLPGKPEGPVSDPVQDPSNDLVTSNDNPFGDTLQTETTAWHEIVDAAERHNQPGTFTSLIGWEWSSIPTGANLHRIVWTPDGADKAKQFLPYGSDQSQYPEDLWGWLQATQDETGTRFLAMPHNSNLSKGYMYSERNLKGDPITAASAEQRMKWEPVSEITQIKGDSETHPTLSPDDSFADFETFPFYLQSYPEEFVATPADYMRSALKTGMRLEHQIKVNPFQFGVIGSTDSHSGLASPEENNFWGKFARDSTPGTKRSDEKLGGSGSSGWDMSASGLAAAWTRENTRAEIFDAFQRREVYATTGTRLKLRLFAGWNLGEEDLTAPDFAARGYAGGVPMGGELQGGELQAGATEDSPTLLIRAEKDPVGGNLDRVQVIKGWIDADGREQEKVFNVAWSGERQLDPNGSLPDIKNTVDLTTGEYTNSVGAESLSVAWTDPEFKASEQAFYYVRVLQIHTPRHSLLDALALQIDIPEEGPATIQERAYSSPIWYTP